MDNTAKSKGGRAFDVFNTLRTSSRILHDDTQVEKFISWVLSVAKSKGMWKVLILSFTMVIGFAPPSTNRNVLKMNLVHSVLNH